MSICVQLGSGLLSMAAGDFLEVYNKTDCLEAFDCVATVFFIDTARNIMAYLRTIHRVLKQGGIWINYGPLLYHFADNPNEQSISLPYEEIRRLLDKFSFIVEHESLDNETSYAQNDKSMLQYKYKCAYWVCRKRASQTNHAQS